MSGDKIIRLKQTLLLCLLRHGYFATPSQNNGQTAEPTSTNKVPNLILRDEWGAANPRIWPKLVKITHPVPYVAISYFKPDITDDKMALQSIQKKHQEAGEPDIQSNFLIGKDGKIYEGRGWLFEPSKSIELPSFNGRFIEISYIGDFNNADSSHPCFKATWDVLEYGKKHGYLDENFRFLTEGDKVKKLN